MSNARMLSYDQRLHRYLDAAPGRPLTGAQVKRARKKANRAAVVGDRSAPVPWTKPSVEEFEAVLNSRRP